MKLTILVHAEREGWLDDEEKGIIHEDIDDLLRLGIGCGGVVVAIHEESS